MVTDQLNVIRGKEKEYDVRKCDTSYQYVCAPCELDKISDNGNCAEYTLVSVKRFSMDGSRQQ